MPRVVCAGHVNWDVTLYVDALPAVDGEARVHEKRAGGGGSAANVAAGLVGLGVAAGVVGAVGDDDVGRTVRRELSDRGIDLGGLRTVEGGETTEKYVLVDEAGRVCVLGKDGANETLTPEDLEPAMVAGADHLHLTGQRPATAAALADLAADAGATVSVDPGRRIADRDVSAVIDRADVVFVNRLESATLDDSDPSGGGALVVTYGEAGATARANGQRYAHPGFPARPVDATGAGDAFAAGFIAYRLDGADFERALAFGNACGAVATEQRGARAELDRVEAVRSAGITEE